MKKRIALVFAAAMMTFALTACGTDKKTATEKETTTEASKDNSNTNKNDADKDNTNKEDSNKDEAVVKEAVEIFNQVWATYGEDEKFAAGGGDSENLSMEGAAKFDVSKVEELDGTLGFPQDSADLIDDAASLVHMMNANTFTGAAYHVKDAKNTETLAASIKDNILARQWICGFPEKLLIVQVGEDYLVSAFGNGEIMDNFKAKLTAEFSGAKVLVEQAIE